MSEGEEQNPFSSFSFSALSPSSFSASSYEPRQVSTKPKRSMASTESGEGESEKKKRRKAEEKVEIPTEDELRGKWHGYIASMERARAEAGEEEPSIVGEQRRFMLYIATLFSVQAQMNGKS